MDKVIEASGLCFDYNNSTILDNIEFSVNKGDFVSIIGANGSGKSTLLKLILGQLIPKDGQLKIFDKPAGKFNDWGEIGYVPQNYNSVGNFPATSGEIVAANLFSKIGLMHFLKKEHKDRVKKALKIVGMEGFEKRLIGEMSGGQQQRVMIARILVSSPQIMILDEPTAGIDSKSALRLYELLYKLNKEQDITIMMVTHDAERVSKFSNRIFCLEEGSLVELGQSQLADELMHKHKHPHKTQEVD